MNNYRLSTGTKKGVNVETAQSLIDEVLRMDNIYIKNQDGLRIKTKTLLLVHSQLFYILASGSNGEILIFNGTTECAIYFDTNSQAINLKLAKELPISRKLDKIEFILSRKPL